MSFILKGITQKGGSKSKLLFESYTIVGPIKVGFLCLKGRVRRQAL